MSEHEDMTVAELKDVLRERGLPLSGKKADLIARLLEDDSTSGDEEDEEFDDDFDDLEDDEDWDEEKIHVARQKPKLDDETKAALAFRKAQLKKQPAFRRQEWFRYRRLARTGWRKPKGNDSSMRKNRKYRPPMARIGFGKLASVRGLHPSGFREVMVHRPDDLDAIDPNTEAARVGARVGGRKRAIIHERADELGIRVLNRRRGV
jgi:large subunit ribosomal protein L32e